MNGHHALREPSAMQRVMLPHLPGMGDAIEACSILMDHSATPSSSCPRGSQGQLGIFSISTALRQLKVPMRAGGHPLACPEAAGMEEHPQYPHGAQGQ